MPLTYIMVDLLCLCLGLGLVFLHNIQPETDLTGRETCFFVFVCEARFCITMYYLRAHNFLRFLNAAAGISLSSLYAPRHIYLFLCFFLFFQLLICDCALYFLLCRSYKSIGSGAEKVAWYLWFAICGPKWDRLLGNGNRVREGGGGGGAGWAD